MKLLKLPLYLLSLAAVGLVVYVGALTFKDKLTIQKLVTENKQLQQAITNLTTENQIGYAKVIDQQIRDGRMQTTLKFVETAFDKPTEKILEKKFTIEGDIIHFDALIVKFDEQLVLDGKARALYLWRRVYGEKMAPQDGFAIEQAGAEPARYKGLLKALPIDQRQLFWEEIWDLANNPDKLKPIGITAVYGNAVYTRLRPGLIYVFKINASGQVYPEIIPDI